VRLPQKQRQKESERTPRLSTPGKRFLHLSVQLAQYGTDKAVQHRIARLGRIAMRREVIFAKHRPK
jgi:hypothetical protein